MSSIFAISSLPAVILLLFSGPSSALDHRSDVRHLRPLSPILDQALVTGYQHSETLRRLVAELDRSNVIVHLVPRATSSGPAGALTLVTCAGGVRFLRVAIDQTLAPNARIGILGHELQHAVEIARAGWVQDQASFATLFHDIGFPSTGLAGRQAFETESARQAEARVLDEVRHRSAESRRRTTILSGVPTPVPRKAVGIT